MPSPAVALSCKSLFCAVNARFSAWDVVCAWPCTCGSKVLSNRFRERYSNVVRLLVEVSYGEHACSTCCAAGTHVGAAFPNSGIVHGCHEMDFEPSERLTNINKYKHCSAFYFCFSKKLRKRKPGSFIGDCHQSGWVGRRSGFTDLFSFRPVVTGGIAPQKHFCAPQILF